VNVASVRLQIHDWIADKLTGAVVGDVAAASRLEHGHALLVERFRRCHDVRAIVTVLHAERDDGRVLQQEQLIRDAPRFPILDERLLQRETVGVTDHAKPAHLDLAA
jgi:hypothetical protein